MKKQCERFNCTLINKISTLQLQDKPHWKDFIPTLIYAYDCTENNAIDLSPDIWTETKATPWSQIQVAFQQIHWKIIPEIYTETKYSPQMVLQVGLPHLAERKHQV